MGIRKEPASTGARGNITPFCSSSDVLSNMFPCALFNGVDFYNCSEQMYQHTKAVFYENFKLGEKILQSLNGYAAKRLAKGLHSPTRQKLWFKKNRQIMASIIRLKVKQNAHVRAFLQTSAHSQLIEANPWDYYWSAGKSKRELQRSLSFTGHNYLGKIYMQVRDEHF